MILRKQEFFQKRIYHWYPTLVAMFLEHVTEEFVVPQKILVCIASNACHFWWSANVLVRMLPFQNIKHIDIMDRGGLWKVNENVTSIFKIAERYFRIATQKHVVKIDSKSTVSNLMSMLLFYIMLQY